MQPRKTRTRYEIENHARFLTFSCDGRSPYFLEPAIADLFAHRLIWCRTRLGFALHAWVVMPEHVHLLIMTKPPEVTVSKILMSLKRPVARNALAILRENDPTLKHFWLPGGGYDRNIYSHEEMQEKFDFIHTNPVKRGLVERPEDWRWSSCRAWSGLETEWPEHDRWT